MIEFPDDFQEITPPVKAAGADLVASVALLGRQKSARLLLSFRAGVLDEIGGPRFNVDFSPSRYVLRIRQVPGFGRFESRKPPKGDRLMLSVPLPAAIPTNAQRCAPEFHVLADQGVILVELDEMALTQHFGAQTTKPAAAPADSARLSPGAQKAAEAARTKELIREAAMAFPASGKSGGRS